MDIQLACQTLRHCNECFVTGAPPRWSGADAFAAAQAVKRFLERAKADGRPIRELDIAEPLLYTRQGLQRVMPYVFSVEAMLAHERRRQSS